MSSEMFNLSWNDFDKCASSSFKDLLDQDDFVDVTLVSEDDREIKCHKVVLSACSPILKNILIRNPHQHPLIFLSGVKYSELKSLLNFMYLGQTEVGQDNLNTFMNIASKFKIKGLMQEEQECQLRQDKPANFVNDFSKPDYEEHSEKKVFQQEYPLNETLNAEQNSFHPLQLETVETDDSFTDSSFVVVTNSEDLNKIGSEYECDKCEYRSKYRGDVSSHMKAQHEGIKYSCGMCEYKSGYLSNLNKHTRKKHSSEPPLRLSEGQNYVFILEKKFNIISVFFLVIKMEHFLEDFFIHGQRVDFSRSPGFGRKTEFGRSVALAFIINSEHKQIFQPSWLVLLVYHIFYQLIQ